MYQDQQKFWIFTQQQLNQIRQIKNEAYSSIYISHPEFDDSILEKMDIHNLIKLMRNYKIQNSPPFLLDKMIETGVTLLKRYYLVKNFGQGSRAQIVMCAVYLGMKLEEIGDKWISGFAQKNINNKKIEAYHYSQHGYTEHEMSFLMAINFQIKHLSVIRPFEGLLERLKEARSDMSMQLIIIQKDFLEILQPVYYDDMFFTVHPAKTALCIMLIVMERHGIEMDCIDRGDIAKLIEENKDEIEWIRQRLLNLKKFNAKESVVAEKSKNYKGMLRQQFKKPAMNLKRSSTSVNLFNEIPKV